MMKKIMSKTIVFVAVMVFIFVFKSIFGEVNTYLGVTTLVLILVTLGRDLTARPGKTLLALVSINLLMGLCAFMVGQSLWLGLIINFIVMFLIAYYFSYELRKPLNMLVGLHYILMMTNPITTSDLPMRMMGLLAGPVLLMGIQLVVNKNKSKKLCPNLLSEIETQILMKINLLKEGQSVSDRNELILNKINAVKVIVHENTPSHTHLSLFNRTIISVLSCLERINLLLDSPCDHAILNEVERALEEKSPVERECIDSIVRESQQEKVYEFTSTIQLFLQEYKQFMILSQNPTEETEQNEMIPDEFKEKKILNRYFNYCSIRFGYGVRLGFLVAITSFITNYFHLNYGTWLVYTVFALTQPFIEFTVTKAKKRIIGTSIGAIAIFVLFLIIPDPGLRVVLLLVAGYLMSYMNDYQNIVIFVTICSICSAASSLDFAQSGVVVLSRVFFVIIGIIISIIVNQLFMKSSYADEEKGLKNLKLNILDYMFKEIYVFEHGADKTIDYLYLIAPYIENRIEHWDLDISEEHLYKQRFLMNYLHQVHLQVMLNPSTEKMINQIKPLIDSETKESLVEKINEMMNDLDDLNDWQVCSNSLLLIQQIPNI